MLQVVTVTTLFKPPCKKTIRKIIKIIYTKNLIKMDLKNENKKNRNYKKK